MMVSATCHLQTPPFFPSPDTQPLLNLLQVSATDEPQWLGLVPTNRRNHSMMVSATDVPDSLARHSRRARRPTTEPPILPTNEWLQSLFGLQPPNPNSMETLRQRFPSLSHASSFADIIDVSSKYMKSNAIKTADDHAEAHYQSHPRISLDAINFSKKVESL